MSRLITLMAFYGHFAGLSPAASGTQRFPAFVDPLPRCCRFMQFESLVDLLGHRRDVRFRNLADDVKSGEIAPFCFEAQDGRGAWAKFMLALLRALGLSKQLRDWHRFRGCMFKPLNRFFESYTDREKQIPAAARRPLPAREKFDVR